VATEPQQNKPLELLQKQTQLLQSIYELQETALEQQETRLEEEYKRSLNWEYAEISLVTPSFGAYIWIYEEGKLKRLKGIEGQNKVMVALDRMGKEGWELVTAIIDHLETVRLFLKRPRQDSK